MGRKGIEVASLLLLLMAVVVIGLFGCASQPERDDGFAHVADRPLLETKHQVWEAQASGYCAFRFGDEYYVVRNLPREYVEYSRDWSRMM